VLPIANLVVLPFQKICGNCHITYVTISPMDGVYYNTCHSKSTIQKLSFLHGSIATNGEQMLLTIEGKWLEIIVCMTKFEFLDLLHPKQVQFLISIHIHGNFDCRSHLSLLAFKKTSNNLSHK